MKVSELISARAPITVSPDNSVEMAVGLLRQHGVRHLFHIKEGQLVGILSDRDLKKALDPLRSRVGGEIGSRICNFGALSACG